MTEIHDRIRDWWNDDADVYDRAPSHAASDPVEAAAWRAALEDALPPSPATVLDIGAGTGAMSLLAAELGHRVTALDLASAMLDRARSKADARGLELSFVVGRADQPPSGPFDAVMERHVLWTSPNPVETLAAWRGVVRPGGRLALFEGIWGRSDAVQRARDAAAEALRRAYGIPHDHHAEYDEAILAELPLARLPSAQPLIDAVYAAGWRAVRIRRLRDVEWARRIAAHPVLGALESVPQFALIADAS
ncbi:MAG: class I SAM-dependent methyltransferase [Actinomycetota bacterium]|jgi:SAM-dependent methyltransferase